MCSFKGMDFLFGLFVCVSDTWRQFWPYLSKSSALRSLQFPLYFRIMTSGWQHKYAAQKPCDGQSVLLQGRTSFDFYEPKL